MAQLVHSRQPSSSQRPDQATVVIYYMCDEPIPYSTRIHSMTVTLRQFKDLIVKKGSFRFDDDDDDNAESHIVSTATEPSAAAHKTAQNKIDKYSILANTHTHIFYPFAIETAGTWHEVAI